MKKTIYASNNYPTEVERIHCVIRSAYGGFTNDLVFSGTVAELLNTCTKEFTRRSDSICEINPNERYLVLLCSSTISSTYYNECYTTDSKSKAFKLATEWLDPDNHEPASDFTHDVYYYASIVDLAEGVEEFYKRSSGNIYDDYNRMYFYHGKKVTKDEYDAQA